MALIMRILEDLAPLNRVVCSSDYEQAVSYLTDILPFQVLEFTGECEHNGWIIPPKWDVCEAQILRDGALVYDGTKHPLGVIALSAPFKGRVDREELKRHLHYDHRFPDALPFHFRQLFRSWEREWGFCVPKTLYDGLEPGEFEVVIETKESAGFLKVLEYTLEGTLDETIAVCATLDHPGVAVGVEVFRRLRERPRKFTYKLIVPPSTIGTEYYLAGHRAEDQAKISQCLCLWMLGTRTQLALQESRGARSNIEVALEHVLTEGRTDFRRAPFEHVMINDDYIWEGYGVPTTSLSRFPYPEYHTSFDNMTIMSQERLEEAVALITLALEDLENTPLVYKLFQGTVALSNPRYDLYVDPGQVALGHTVEETTKRMRLLMDYVPALDAPRTTRAIARDVGLPEEMVNNYLRRWADKGLLAMK
jgi:aminopeptidase-like protein